MDEWIKFNPDNKTWLTYGELYRPTLKIKDKKNALEYKKALVEWVMGRRDIDCDEECTTKAVEYYLVYNAQYCDGVNIERFKKLFDIKETNKNAWEYIVPNRSAK